MSGNGPDAVRALVAPAWSWSTALLPKASESVFILRLTSMDPGIMATSSACSAHMSL